MYPTLSLGPLVLPTAGIIYILGAWLVLTVIERAARSLQLDADSTYGLAATALAAGFIGARLIFVILHWPAFQENLIGIIWPLNSGYNFVGGVVIGGAAGLLYGRAKQLPPGSTLDALAPGLLVALMCVSLADFLGGPGYGSESTLPWAIDVFGIERHPIQIYELLVAGLALAVWWWGFKRREFEGQLFLMATAVYAAGRLFVDAFRANTPLIANGFHLVQIASLVILLACLLVFARLLTRENQDQERSGEVTGID